MNLRRLAAAPALALLASTLIFAGSAPSSADPGNPFDVTAVKVSDLRVNSGSCRSIPIKLLHNGGELEDAWAKVEIWKGSKYIDSEILFDYATNQISGSMLHCPTFEGLGTFRAGPSDVDWASLGYANSGEFRDATTGSFKVLQDARVTSFKAKRSGKKVTLTGKSSWYCVDASRWAIDQKGWKLKLQRQAGNGSWKTIKSFRAGKKGFAVTTSRSKRAAYRVMTPAAHNTWSGVSKTIRK